METQRFKTSLKCNGCISAITPAMNSITGIDSWNVDLSTPDRVLTVVSEKEIAQEVISGIKKAGYEIEELK
jgi:copper chaperone